jgi:hypothetical protein
MSAVLAGRRETGAEDPSCDDVMSPPWNRVPAPTEGTK